MRTARAVSSCAAAASAARSSERKVVARDCASATSCVACLLVSKVREKRGGTRRLLVSSFGPRASTQGTGPTSLERPFNALPTPRGARLLRGALLAREQLLAHAREVALRGLALDLQELRAPRGLRAGSLEREEVCRTVGGLLVAVLRVQ